MRASICALVLLVLVVSTLAATMHKPAGARLARARALLAARSPMYRRSAQWGLVPVSIPAYAFMITLTWSGSTSIDLDSVLLAPYPCMTGSSLGLLSGKIGDIECIAAVGGNSSYAFLGGSYGAYALGVNPPNMSPTPDITTDSTTAPGVEELYIANPPNGSTYQHVVYQASQLTLTGYTAGLSEVEVVIWQYGGSNPYAPTILAQYEVTNAAFANLPRHQLCEGRFWNTFSITPILTPGTQNIASLDITLVNTVTENPAPSWPTTSFESQPRTGRGTCTA